MAVSNALFESAGTVREKLLFKLIRIAEIHWKYLIIENKIGKNRKNTSSYYMRERKVGDNNKMRKLAVKML